MSDSVPDFPDVRDADKLSDADKKKIAEAAWAQANGSVTAFGQLCAEHVRGEINLLGGQPGETQPGAASQAGGGAMAQPRHSQPQAQPKPEATAKPADK